MATPNRNINRGYGYGLNPRASMIPLGSSARMRPSMGPLGSVFRSNLENQGQGQGSSAPGMSSARQNIGGTAATRLTATTGNLHKQSGLGAPAVSQAHGVHEMRDLRQLREKVPADVMIAKIQEYLVTHNFEIEMKYTLTSKTLKSPPQKDFALVFQWIYHRLDPGYKFTKSIDNEVYALLRVIKYPYFESLSKSQLAAVGGENWSSILSMLYWMVQLCISMEYYDNTAETANKTDEELMNDILERYSTSCYRLYLQGEHNFTEYKAEAEHDFDQFSQLMENSIKEAESEVQEVRDRHDQLRRELDSIEDLESKTMAKKNALVSDLQKLNGFITKMNERKSRWSESLKSAYKQLEDLEQQQLSLKSRNDDLRQQTQQRGVSPSDLDRLWSERERLSKSLDMYNQQLGQLVESGQQRFRKAEKMANELQQYVQQYNSLLYKVGIADESFRIDIDQPLIDSNLGKSPEQLLQGRDLRNSIRQSLLGHRQQITDRIHGVEGAYIRLKEDNRTIKEMVTEKEGVFETLNTHLATQEQSYEKAYQTMVYQSDRTNADYERQEHQIQMMLTSLQDTMASLDRQCGDVDISYNQTREALESSRLAMNDQLAEMLNYIVSFKLHIQKTLSDQDNYVSSCL